MAERVEKSKFEINLKYTWCLLSEAFLKSSLGIHSNSFWACTKYEICKICIYACSCKPSCSTHSTYTWSLLNKALLFVCIFSPVFSVRAVKARPPEHSHWSPRSPLPAGSYQCDQVWARHPWGTQTLHGSFLPQVTERMGSQILSM